MKKNLLICLLMMYGFSANAQISIDFPKERQVFQRDNSNNSFIHISGNFSVEYDSITAKIFPRVVGQGTASPWQTVDYRDGKPYFYGKISGTGGWYTLGVKAYKNGIQIDSVGLNRVGIGEVFVIAGQSNATGSTGTGGLGLDSDEDRSNVMLYANKFNDYNALPLGFSPMDRDSVATDSVIIGPFQITPWCWGKVSEDLVDSFNVPVLFYGAGFGGTSVLWWKQSANGETLTGQPFFVQEQYNHPYGALGSVLRMYAGLTGLRAVLWHQGESDFYMPTVDYQTNLTSLIARSRDHMEETTLAWMVARASYTGGNSSPNIVLAQNNVIGADANVYPGPETDALGGYTYRSDNIHMDKPAGLTGHANLWVNYLTNGFLSSSTPTLAQDFIELDFVCSPGNTSTPITLSTPDSYDKYAWSNRENTGSEALGNTSDGDGDYTVMPPTTYQRLNWEYDSTSSITVGTGKYALNVRKATSGKVLFSPVVDLNTFTLPTNPTFTSSATQIRSGDTLTLTGSTCNGTYLWDTVATGSPYELYPTATDNYTVACKTLHCLSPESAPIEVVVSSCFAEPLNLTASIYGTESPYKSQQTITSTQLLSPSGKIDYSANQTITLGPGFTAKAGSVFKATIQNCP
jgi:hypothetical protein